jgi:DNA-binding NarL/FixJ family response regulator
MREKTGQKICRILIADDHAVVRRGLRVLLESQADVEICGEATNGRQAIELAKEHKPDVALVDLTMPEVDGFEATPEILKASPGTEVIILTMHCAESMARSILQSGARGYVLKSDADSELLEALKKAREHKAHFSPALTSLMVNAYVCQYQDAGQPFSTGLTNRETEVVRLLASGRSNKEIAAMAGVSTRTIESHRNRVMHKMNFTSFSDLVRFAVRVGMVEP